MSCASIEEIQPGDLVGVVVRFYLNLTAILWEPRIYKGIFMGISPIYESFKIIDNVTGRLSYLDQDYIIDIFIYSKLSDALG